MTALPDESVLRDALRQVQDPEAGMNIIDGVGDVRGRHRECGGARPDRCATARTLSRVA